jgi:hypothetical protein
MDSLNPGIGERTKQDRRMADAERFLGRYPARRIIAKDANTGKNREFYVLARPGPNGEDESIELGAFFGVFREDGKWMLQGGQVTGGSKTETVKNIELAKTGSEPADGHQHWLEITGNGTVVQGRLVAGFTMTAVKDAKGATITQPTLPTKASPNGRKCVVLLGIWNSGRFQPSQTGNIAVSFCPGAGYTVSRGS